jgi:nicotinate-nucleotide adenylyltransferase
VSDTAPRNHAGLRALGVRHRVSLGILGGAFDPPHIGHVALARAAIEELDLERLLVLVVADPGHKRTIAPAESRLELARLAFEDLPGVDVELDPHTRTVDSLETRRLDDAVFVIGGDEFADFWQWKSPERILELVRLGVAMRPGVPDDRVREAHARLLAPDRISYFPLEPISVSSSLVRERARRGEPIDELVPPQVAAAIARLGLYAAAE